MNEMIYVFKDGENTFITDNEARKIWDSIYNKYPDLVKFVVGMILDSEDISIKKYSQNRKIAGLYDLTYNSETNSTNFVITATGSIPKANSDIKQHRYILEFSDQTSNK